MEILEQIAKELYKIRDVKIRRKGKCSGLTWEEVLEKCPKYADSLRTAVSDVMEAADAAGIYIGPPPIGSRRRLRILRPAREKLKTPLSPEQAIELAKRRRKR